MSDFPHNYEDIPKHMMAAIRRYIDERIEPGDFLTAVITNDLKKACGYADSINIHLIPVYASYFYNEAPSSSWGSVEKFNAWLGGE